MLFMVYSDLGNIIKGYCVPDGFSAYSSVNIIADGTVLNSFQPAEYNEHMAGRHATGNVGFTIDDTMIAGLAEIKDLEIREIESDLIIYKRSSQPPAVAQNVFRLETQLFPQWRLDAALKDSFTYWYQRVDQFSAETTRQILSYHSFGSLYSSGRILYQNYDFYLRDHQKILMLMQDPYCELAERLLIFSRLNATSAATLLGERDILTYGPALDLARQLTSFDEGDLRKGLKRASPAAMAAFSNPVVRQLSAKTPDEPADRNAMVQSLRCLSEFAVVGLHDRSPEFLGAVAELMEIDPAKLPAISRSDEVQRVGHYLREIAWVEAVIEKDLELYHHVKAAYEAVEREVQGAGTAGRV